MTAGEAIAQKLRKVARGDTQNLRKYFKNNTQKLRKTVALFYAIKNRPRNFARAAVFIFQRLHLVLYQESRITV